MGGWDVPILHDPEHDVVDGDVGRGSDEDVGFLLPVLDPSLLCFPVFCGGDGQHALVESLVFAQVDAVEQALESGGFACARRPFNQGKTWVGGWVDE